MLQRLLAALCLASLEAGAVETMRISMGTEQAEVRVTGEALSFGEDDEEAVFKPVPTGRVTVRLEKGRLTLNGAPVVGDAVRFRAGEWATDAGVPGGAVRAGGVLVRGDVVVRAGRTGLEVINVIPLEEYLVGVLGSEMPKSFPPEALKAQAVAARTYALHRKLEAYDEPYHLGSSVLSQVYRGLAAEDARTRQAVESTRGLVLTYELAPIEAYFHASCGGRTESGLDALGRELPYLVPVDCPCGRLKVSRWQVKLPAAELSERLGLETSQLRVVDRSRTGRARRVLVASRTIDAVTFRERLGYSRVKSLAFEVRPGDGAFTLTGRGLGHGAGMCQWGARALAESGWDFERILAHYYPGTELQVLY